MQNRYKDSFPSDTKKNLKECMAITLGSGREWKKKEEEEERKLTEKEKKTKTGNNKLNSSEIAIESEKS